MLTLVIDRPTEQTVAALTESPFQDGYCAYLDRRGPGIGRLRNAGWLQARKDLRARDTQRAYEQAAITDEIAQLAEERLDENDRHYRWQY